VLSPGELPPTEGIRPRPNRYKVLGSLLGACGILLSGILVACLVARMDLHRTMLALAEARRGWFVLAGGLVLVLPFLSAFRWMNILKSQKGLQVRYRQALRATLLSSSLDSLIPAKGSEVAKAVLLRSSCGIISGLGAVVLERCLDFLVLGTLALSGSVLSGSKWGLWAGACLSGASLAAMAAISLAPWSRVPVPSRARRLLLEVQGVHRACFQNPRSVLKAALGSLLSWTTGSLVLWSLTQAFGGGVEFGYLAAIYPLAIVAGLAPITLGGMGTRDGAFVFFLSAVMTSEKATLIGFGYTVLVYWMLSLVCSSMFLLGGGLKALRSSGRPLEPAVPADPANIPTIQGAP
jgi:glycosyltransferase 2 family protein